LRKLIRSLAAAGVAPGWEAKGQERFPCTAESATTEPELLGQTSNRPWAWTDKGWRVTLALAQDPH
jgi:hypothetical protein